MENKIILAALKNPKGYPWTKILSYDREIINKTLEKFNLLDNNLKLASWEVDITIYKVAFETEDFESTVKLISEELKNRTYINKEVIQALLQSKHLFKHRNNTFKEILFKQVELDSSKFLKENLIFWLTEIISYFEATKGMGERKYLLGILEKIFFEYFNINSINPYDKRKFEISLSRKALDQKDNLELFFSKFSKKKSCLEPILKLINGNTTKLNPLGNIDIDSMIQNLQESTNTNSSKKGILEKTAIKENKNIDKLLSKNNMESSIETKLVDSSKNTGKKSSIKSTQKDTNSISNGQEVINSDEVFSKKEVKCNLSEFCKSFGYQLAENTDVIKSKEEYKKLTKDAETKVIKELIKVDNYSSLSQLYNAFKDIHNTSKENLEAILNNFFNILSDLGFEIDSEGSQIGDSIKVNMKDALKDFILSQPVSANGEIEGIIKYHAWTYNNEKIMPMVIERTK